MKKIHLLIFLIGITLTISAQNVGIGTNTPTAQLHTTGTVRHAALNGIGIRPVFVDSSGNLLVNMPPLPSSSATNNIARSIPDINCIGVASTNTLSGLPASVYSAGISVTINITHPRLADLSIYLTAPGGSIINLSSPSAAVAGANFNNTVFAEGGALLSSGSAPYTGHFKPYADMAPSICGITPTVASFHAIGNGTMNPNGTWTLKVIDNSVANTGTLNSWTISVVSGLGIDGTWGLKGNAGTNANNFIGTTDKTALRFKVNNVSVGLIDTIGNVFFGSGGSAANMGSENIGIGGGSLVSNTSGERNTAVGSLTLLENDTGNSNTAIGSRTLFLNHTGNRNTATGGDALFNNYGGNSNSAFGDSALFNNQWGMNNVAVGVNALLSSTGNDNIAIGRDADVTGPYSNAIAIGSGAKVDAFNKVRLGNTAVTVIEGQVPFSSPSDGRFKTNITETVKGLEFITKLRPVVYNFQTKKYDAFLRNEMPGNARYVSQDFSESESIRQSGFVAQEVEEAAKQANYDFNGIIIPKTEKQAYGLSYAQFVVPLVKAVQEQQYEIELLKKENAEIKDQLLLLEGLRKEINLLKQVKN